MTQQEVRKRVLDMRSAQLDTEDGHIREDELYLDVLSAIANGARNPSALAAEALKTRTFIEHRWCS